MSAAPLCAAPDRSPRTPRLRVPAGACDCHVHVFGPADRYPYRADRAYTPPDSPPEDLARLQEALGFQRAVVVQASVHGTDNRAVLDAIALAPERRRGVAAVGPDVSERELRRLHEGGVRGARFNLVDRGGMPFDDLSGAVAFSERIADLGWHIELLVHVEDCEELPRLVRGCATPVVVGHLGYTKVSKGLDHPGYRAFLDLLGDGECWVKLTGPYRISAERAIPYSDVAAFAEALVAAAPERLLWGSDWPHVMLTGSMPNEADLVDLLATWIPDEAIRRKVLVDNPERLYGFG